MKLSTRSRYAVRLLVALAVKQKDTPVLLKEIADEEEISTKYLSQLIIPLRSAGLIRSFRGAKGGYVLGRSADSITVEQIVSVMEGGTEVIRCAADEEACDRIACCVTRPVWKGLGAIIADYLRKYTVAMLAEKVKQKEGV